MLHFYLQKGFDLDKLVNLSSMEKVFYYSSMELALEEKKSQFSLE